MRKPWNGCMNEQDLYRIINRYGDHRERLMFVADACARTWQGSLVSIGSDVDVTIKLAAVARKWRRRLLLVHPWREEDLAILARHTLPYKDIVGILAMSPLDDRAIDQLQRRQWCFAYVGDAEQHAPTVANIVAVAHAGIVAIAGGTMEFAARMTAHALRYWVSQAGEGDEVYMITGRRRCLD